MSRFGVLSCAVALFCAGALSAGPHIVIDSTEYQAGTVIEGKADRLNAVFTVKNTGDADLKLTQVRPGCGCTVINRYDSLIKPGNTSKIEAAVNIKGWRAQPITKVITVTSNGGTNGKDTVIQVHIHGMIESVVEFSTKYISFSKNDTAKSRLIYVTSRKADLKVTKVSFGPLDYNPSADNSHMSDSAKKLIVPVKNVWIPTDSIRSDGFHVFKLQVFKPSVDYPVDGRLIVETNHPESKVTTMIQASLNR